MKTTPLLPLGFSARRVSEECAWRVCLESVSGECVSLKTVPTLAVVAGEAIVLDDEDSAALAAMGGVGWHFEERHEKKRGSLVV